MNRRPASAALQPLILCAWVVGTPVVAQPVGTPLDRAAEKYAAGDVAGALALWEEAGERADADPEAAGAARNNRCVVLRLQGETLAALEDCGAAVRIREETGDLRGLARSLNNLGLTLQELARFDEAETAFLRAMALNEQRRDPAGTVLVLNNLAALLSTRGAHARALAALDRVEELAAGHAAEPWAAEQEIVAVLNRGVALEGLGAFREALELYRPWTEPGRLDEHRRGSLHVNLGTLYRNLGDAELAVEHFEIGGRLLERSGDAAGAANALSNRGRTLHVNLGRLEEARSLLEQAVERFVEIGSRSEELRGLIALGQVRADLGDLEEADRTLARAIGLARASNSWEGRWRALHGRARLDRRRGDLAAAIGALEEALEVIEARGAELGAAHRWAEYLAERRGVHELLVDSLLELGGAENERRALLVAWAAKNREVLEVVAPQAGPRSSTLEEVNAALGEAWLVELFRAESRLIRFTLRAGSLRVDVLGPAEPTFAAARRLARAAENGEPTRDEDRRGLGASLFGGLASELLSGRPPVLRLAPDGPLRRLPFDLLEIDGRRLLDLVPLALLPGGPFLTRADGPPTGLPPTVLAVASPAWNATAGGRLLAERFDLPDLPGSRAEVRAIAARLDRATVEILEGEGAGEAVVERALAHSPRIVHLATHAVVDDRTPAILLGADADDDGLWTPPEILAVEADPSLVVLSACRSSVTADGNGLSSLSGAFLAGGAASVVATLWDVDDETTAVFMDRFYAALARGRPPVEALAAVKRAFRDDPRWEEPSGWAAFVLIGDGTRPVVAADRALLLPILGLAALVALLGTAVLGLRRRR